MNPMDLINSLLAPQQMAQAPTQSPMMAGNEMNGPKPQGQGGILESVIKSLMGGMGG